MISTYKFTLKIELKLFTNQILDTEKPFNASAQLLPKD